MMIFLKFIGLSIAHLALFWHPAWRAFSSVEWVPETVIWVRSSRFGHIAVAREPDWGDIIGFEAFLALPCGFGRRLGVRLGWDILAPKWPDIGLAPLVNGLD